MRKKIKFYTDFLQTALRHPFSFLNKLNVNNFKVLIRALRSEPPLIILKNFHRLLTQNQVAEEDIFLHRELREDPKFAEGVEKTDFYNQQYQTWLQRQPKSYQSSLQQADVSLSITIDAFGANELHVQRIISALAAQTYRNWEAFFIVDKDADAIVSLNCKTIRVKSNSAAQRINQGIQQSKGDYILWMRASDSLVESAFQQGVEFIEANNSSVVYADSDRIDENGNRFEPHFKPDFNLDYLLSFDYIHSPMIVKKEIGELVNWLTEDLVEDYNYDFYLKLINQQIVFQHCPKMLFHLGEPMVFNVEERRSVIENYLNINQIKAEVEKGLLPQTMRIRRAIETNAKVSIIIPTKDNVEMLQRCVESLLATIRYPNFEIFIVSNNSEQSATYEYLASLTVKQENVRYERYDVPFNFAEINNWAVEQVTGDYILFLNNDVVAIEARWLENMVAELQREEVGAVGAKLLYENNLIQHAGVLLKVRGTAEHGHKLFPAEYSGYFKRLNVTQQVSAVTGACLLTEKKLFQTIDGFDAQRFPVAGNDVDYCLELLQREQLIIYTPDVSLYHLESISRGEDKSSAERNRAAGEVSAFWKKWEVLLESGDSYYHPNLTLLSTDFTLDV
ncbi:MAG: glycosyltransferase [Saprospiraceae bacterium]